MAQVPPLVDPALVVAIRNQMRWNDLHEGQEESLVHTLLDYDDLREGTLVVALGRTEKMLWQVRRKRKPHKHLLSHHKVVTIGRVTWPLTTVIREAGTRCTGQGVQSEKRG